MGQLLAGERLDIETAAKRSGFASPRQLRGAWETLNDLGSRAHAVEEPGPSQVCILTKVVAATSFVQLCLASGLAPQRALSDEQR